MHQRSLLELQGVCTLQGVSTRRTTQDRGRWGSRLRRGAGRRYLRPPRGAPVWAWLLLGALVVPGAWSFLSEEQEELLVELHNHYRGQVSPSASAMLPLRWDPGLKVIAEGYAAKCTWSHNPELEDTGENLFAGTGSLDLREALEKWFLEHLDYNFQNNSCEEDKMCGHYTQMVWADTHRVGCAFHLCNDMKGLGWERVSYLVCNYYPAGNYEGERPYVEGDWCSQCPENLQECENNLCVADTVDEEEEEEEEDEDEEERVVLLPTISDLSPQPEEEEEEEKVTPPPATTDSYVQPETTTSSSSSAEDSEDTQPPDTPAPDTQPPGVPPTAQGEEDVVEEKMEEKEEKETKEEREEREEKMKEEEEEKRKETTDKMEGKGGRET
ncbi:peptidase inhibitor 16-like [Plectropomus leopardus]|uniref:peptidase inhibitor 16-like n=1 Tax=Plectropomus leopardus TaxID=160734 RepID=UPI001C4C31C8|nr:peptidase inhibitor 16-like [Plectropomus leopardus]